MTIEGALISLIKSDADVSAVTTAVYPATAPKSKDELERIGGLNHRITIQRLGTARVYTDDGESGLSRARFQVVAVATKYLDAVELADKLRRALGGYVGTHQSVRFEFIQVVDEDDQPKSSKQDDSAAPVFGRRLDLEIWVREAV